MEENHLSGGIRLEGESAGEEMQGGGGKEGVVLEKQGGNVMIPEQASSNDNVPDL
jgi:hypothetical protein